jgi:DNA oxidative demethylase
MARTIQPSLLAAELAPGVVYRPAFLSASEEVELVAFIEQAPLSTVRFRGFVAKRQVAHYGYEYAYDARQVTPGRPIPVELAPFIARAAAVAGLPAACLSEVLVTRYPAGSGIGWHRDAPVFGEPVVGISLGASALLRLRHRAAGTICRVPLAPRSLYLLAGASRWVWEHHIPPVAAVRYSLTLRVAAAPSAKD